MKAIMPKSWQRLPESEKNKIAEVCEQQMEQQMVAVLDAFIKMPCSVLHEGFGFGQDRLIIGIIIKKDGYGFIFDTQSSWRDTDIGKTVFITREEAEKAIAERRE